MLLLLDTHILLWASGQPGKLSRTVRDLLNDQANTLLFSAASMWEITIKRSLNRADFKVESRVLLRGLKDHGYEELEIKSEHAVAIEQLPLLHRDPFDRILIAQATVEGATLVTADDNIAMYPGPIRKV